MARPLSPSDEESVDFIHVSEPEFNDRSKKEETKAIPDSLDENQWEAVAPSVITPLMQRETPSETGSSMEEKELEERMKKEKTEEIRLAIARESIAIVREQQEKRSSLPLFFSRRCSVCSTRHPTHRVLFSSCGHITCHVCQMESRLESNSDQCPQCKEESGWINLIEEEDPSPILPECTCKRIRRVIGEWRDQLRGLFKRGN